MDMVNREVKKIGKYIVVIQFPSFKKARCYIYLNNKQLYYSGLDTKIKVLAKYRNLNTVKAIKRKV
ncbi:unnamed protein product [marine sediment metagenome]|uniref:Uncharacterized protein n=1 Tax=marine sediment metagenome TaxID=412755 RepID=X1HZI1_9ZZZZ